MIGCTTHNSPKEPPKISITIGDKEVQYTTAKNQWDGAKYDREDTFNILLKKETEAEISYIETGKIAIIHFMKYPPSKLAIYDMLIGKDGRPLYTDKEVVGIPVSFRGDKCSFEVKKNIASALSSTYVENKKDIRGFRVVASWGQNECEYAFIIRTDAFQ